MTVNATILSKPQVKNAGKLLAVLAAAALLFAAFLLANGADPLAIYSNMISSTLFTPYGIGEVLIKSTPLILIAVGTCISAKAGLVNVGGEGQFAIGALFSTAAGLSIGDSLPSFMGIVVMMLAGVFGGAIWSGVAGILKIRANMNETLTTLIMNYIAYQIVSYFVFNDLKDPDSFNWPQTAKIAHSLRLPRIAGKINLGILIALAAAVIVWLLVRKTKWGYSLRIVGGNANAALHAGINVEMVQIVAMLLSGALAGLADRVFDTLFVDIDEKASHHRNPHSIRHVANPPIDKGRYSSLTAPSVARTVQGLRSPACHTRGPSARPCGPSACR